jgi:hypothetical protein
MGAQREQQFSKQLNPNEWSAPDHQNETSLETQLFADRRTADLGPPLRLWRGSGTDAFRDPNS